MECLANMSQEDKRIVQEINENIEKIKNQIDVLEMDTAYQELFANRIASLKSCLEYLNKKMVAIYAKYIRNMSKKELEEVNFVREMYEKASNTLLQNTQNIEATYRQGIADLKQSDNYVNGRLNENEKKVLRTICQYKKDVEISEDGKLSVADLCILLVNNTDLCNKYLNEVQDSKLKEQIQLALKLYEFYKNNADCFDKKKLERLLKGKAKGFYDLAITTLQKEIENMILKDLDNCQQFPKRIEDIIQNMKSSGMFKWIDTLENSMNDSDDLVKEENNLRNKYLVSKEQETRQAVKYLSSLENPQVLRQAAINYVASQRGVTNPPSLRDVTEENLMLEFTKNATSNENFAENLDAFFSDLQTILEKTLSIQDTDQRFSKWKKEYDKETDVAKKQMSAGDRIIQIKIEMRELNNQIEKARQELENILCTESEQKYQTKIYMQHQKEKVELDKRKEEICQILTEKGVMTPLLEEKITKCPNISDLEEIYRPFKGNQEVSKGRRFGIICKMWKKISGIYNRTALDYIKNKRIKRQKQCEQLLLDEEKVKPLDSFTNKEIVSQNAMEEFMFTRNLKHKSKKLFSSEEKKQRYSDCLNKIRELENARSQKESELCLQQNKLDTAKSGQLKNSSSHITKYGSIEVLDLGAYFDDEDRKKLNPYQTSQIKHDQVKLVKRFSELNKTLNYSSYMEEELGNAYAEKVEKKAEKFTEENTNGQILTPDTLIKWGNEVTNAYHSWRTDSKRNIVSLQAEATQKENNFARQLLDLYDYSHLDNKQRLQVIYEIQELIMKLQEAAKKDKMNIMEEEEIKMLQTLNSSTLTENGRNRKRLPNYNYRIA